MVCGACKWLFLACWKRQQFLRVRLRLDHKFLLTHLNSMTLYLDDRMVRNLACLKSVLFISILLTVFRCRDAAVAKCVRILHGNPRRQNRSKSTPFFCKSSSGFWQRLRHFTTTFLLPFLVASETPHHPYAPHVSNPVAALQSNVRCEVYSAIFEYSTFSSIF